jgi:hypothetical protein
MLISLRLIHQPALRMSRVELYQSPGSSSVSKFSAFAHQVLKRFKSAWLTAQTRHNVPCCCTMP